MITRARNVGSGGGLDPYSKCIMKCVRNAGSGGRRTLDNDCIIKCVRNVGTCDELGPDNARIIIMLDQVVDWALTNV